MGVVYSGFDEQLQRRVAIKRIHRRVDDALTFQRSLREAQALARLAHPNIVAVYEVFEVDRQLCIVMEFVAGQTLREWLADNRPSPAETLAVLVQAGRGIVAAHAAGLVHRDLKPDNIMIGDDGRVRVMDFGLALALDCRPEMLEFDAPGPRLSAPLLQTITRAGVLVGTPGYVAPEQHLGLAADTRSDVFSFCVLAFEALHGLRPFHGRDDAALLEATRVGRVAPVEPDRVPAWLDAVIRRGLAVEPAARWPAMDALLDALTSDPLARRRRRIRAVALVLVAGVVITALVYAVLALREAGERAAREAAAARRLDAVEATITRAEAEADHATAEAAFRTFIADPEHRRTRALTRAWLARGDRQRADTTAARAAYAEGYVHAQTPEDEREALRRLSALFVQAWDGVGLDRSVGLLRARGAEDDSLGQLALRSALWRRDLPAAVTELGRAGHPQAAWRPMLDHLARARRPPLAISALEPLPGDGPARIMVREIDNRQVVLLDAALNEVGRWRDEAMLSLVPRTSWAVVQSEQEARLIDVLSGAVLGRGAPGMAALVPFDATRDGVPELFFGRKWPLYGFQRWDELGRAGMRERGAHAGTDTTNSTFGAHAVMDLDGDGRDELAIGFGPWHRFDLRVFRPDARGELELIAARPLGQIGGLAPIQRGGRRLLAAFVDNSCPAPELFPEPPHTGGPPGIHLFEWVAGVLVEVDFLAMPEHFGRFTARDREAVGDLDGDGREDLAFNLDRDGMPWLLLLRQTEAGFEPLLLAGIELFAGAQLDDDAPLELLGISPDGAEMLVLGLGDEPMPALSTIVDPPPPRPPLADPWLVERWDRASDLASLALLDSAAGSLRDAALLTTDRSTKSALLDRAGEIFARGDRALEVLALEHDVHDDPRVRARAQARRAQALSSLGRHEDALLAARALLRAPSDEAGPGRIAAELVEDLTALLAPGEQIELRFDAPLAREWQIHTPGGLRRDPTRVVLELAIPAISAPVAELPIEWNGGPISLDFELDIDRLEFGAGIEVSIADADGHHWFGAAFSGQGGGGGLRQVVWIKRIDRPWTIHAEQDVASGIHRRRVQVQMTYFPERQYADLMVANDDTVQLGRLPVATQPQPGPFRLLIGSFVDSTESSLALGDLRRLTIRGAHLGATPAGRAAQNRPAQLLAEQEPRAALEALARVEPPPPRAAMLRMLALAELGDLAGLTQVAPAALADADDPRWLGDLVLALRRHPLAAAALRGAAGPALLPALRAVWAFAHSHRNDPHLRGEILGGLLEMERLVPRTDAERHALRQLLDVRAELWERSGEPARAGRDRASAEALADTAHAQ
jgi:hypothetical protein